MRCIAVCEWVIGPAQEQPGSPVSTCVVTPVGGLSGSEISGEFE